MDGHMNRTAVVGVVLAWSGVCAADVDPLTGLEFVTITHPGNAAWVAQPNDPSDQANGRGQVNYEYKIAKTEVAGGLYNEFIAVAFDRPQSEWIPFLNYPSVTGGSNHMVGGVTWRQAAIFCNWLTNGKATNREAFLSGAYDVSTFGIASPFGYTDQRERSPGATYFLPTWDEWLKAAHYDPNKVNPDGSVGGWWKYANMRDQSLVYGPPPSFGGDGTGMANAGFGLPGFNEVNIPVGSYPTQLSPWGLLDSAGGTLEWMETARFHTTVDTVASRMMDSSAWGSSPGTANAGDYAGYRGSQEPDFAFSDNGFRIAMAIPAPGPACDSIDFNRDELLPDVQDIADFLFVFAGGVCPTPECNDIDFNNDTLFPDTADIEALLRVFGGGGCG